MLKLTKWILLVKLRKSAKLRLDKVHHGCGPDREASLCVNPEFEAYWHQIYIYNDYQDITYELIKDWRKGMVHNED